MGIFDRFSVEEPLLSVEFGSNVEFESRFRNPLCGREGAWDEGSDGELNLLRADRVGVILPSQSQEVSSGKVCFPNATSETSGGRT